MALRYSSCARNFTVIAAILILTLSVWGCANVQSSSSTVPQSVSVTITPASASVQVSKNQQFTAAVTNTSNAAVTWQVNGTTGGDSAHGTIDTSGMYTAPAAVPSPAAVTIIAISQAQSTKSAMAQATITPTAPAISVAVSQATDSVQVGHTQALTATVQNDSQNKGVTWTLAGAGCSGAACGTLSTSSSASGGAITYTAPATQPAPATVTATATSVADSTKSAVTTITITAATAAISVSVNPGSFSVQTGQTHSITATVQNDSQNKGVAWTLTGAGCTGAACGALSAAASASGVAITYTAPASVPAPGVVTLTAKPVADSTKAAAVAIIITGVAVQPISVAVNPTAFSLQTGKTHTLTATVQNDTQNKGVAWTLTGAGCSGASCGTLSAATSASGTAITYTAPASVPTPAVVTATAKSVSDSSDTATAAITVTATVTGAVTVSISPVRVGLTTGQLQTFTANVTGSTTTTVTWAVDTVPGGNGSVGTISAAGVYTPPATAGTHTVAAIAVADSTVSATASVAITDLAGVFTYHNDLSRDGANTREYALNTSNVNSSTFGKVFACALDSPAYAQPLWMANVAIGGGTHNVLIAATERDTVYAFDADAAPCHTYWTKSLLASGETWGSSNDAGSSDIGPEIGIVGTPVIDPGTKTIYLVTKSKNGSTYHQRLHALSLIDGSEKFSGPSEIAFTWHGITFDPLRQNQRAGLALINGVVYVAYASHGDIATYYGWILGYSASTLAQTTIFNDDPLTSSGGIWMSGGAPAADAANNMFLITGNGEFDGTTQFGDCFLRLSTGSGLNVTGFFAPSNQGSLNASDADLGSGGAAILVDLPSGSTPHLVVGGGKEGKLYLLNRDSLGGNTSNDSGAVQIFPSGNAIFSTPAFWGNTLYLTQITDHLKAFTFNPSSGKFNTAPAAQSGTFYAFPGATPSISSQGSSNGIVWTIEKNNTAVLHAHDASNVATELWNSGGSAGVGVKFTVPTVANGKVYVGTTSEISVYGLSPN